VPEAEAPGPEVAARPARARKLRIGELLVAQGTISEDQLRAGLLEQKRTGRRLGEVLVELGVLGERDFLKTLAGQLEIPLVDLRTVTPEPEALARIPESTSIATLITAKMLRTAPSSTNGYTVSADSTTGDVTSTPACSTL
jgi:Type II secretion system (T2SS), protein E, N-terminal domain